jgi:hypothetical protein
MVSPEHTYDPWYLYSPGGMITVPEEFVRRILEGTGSPFSSVRTLRLPGTIAWQSPLSTPANRKTRSGNQKEFTLIVKCLSTEIDA